MTNHIHTPGIYTLTSNPPQYDCATCGIRYTPSRQADITVYGESVWNGYEEAWAEEGTEDPTWRDTAIAELSEALRLTAEYYDAPAIQGWEWYEALRKWSPGHLAAWDRKKICDGGFCQDKAIFSVTSNDDEADVAYACGKHLGNMMPTLNAPDKSVIIRGIS